MGVESAGYGAVQLSGLLTVAKPPDLIPRTHNNHDPFLQGPSRPRRQTLEFLACACPEFRIAFISNTTVSRHQQCSRFGARRWESTGAEPPPAGGHLPTIATSKLLRNTREAALRTPGIRWLDEDGGSPLQRTIGGRETRKMNVYQAVRDAMAYVRLGWYVGIDLFFCQNCPCERRHSRHIWRGCRVRWSIQVYHGNFLTLSPYRVLLFLTVGPGGRVW